MGIPIGNLRASMTIIYNNELFMIVGYEHAKLGRGAAFGRAKLKNLKTAQVLECTLRDSDNIEEAFVEKRKIQYLYRSGNILYFLDLETYEQLILNDSHIGDDVVWLKDHLELIGIFYNNELVYLELPLSIELKVTDTTPGFRGDTVKGGTKPAKLETSLEIGVPLFVNNGDIVKVDTRTRKYLGRA